MKHFTIIDILKAAKIIAPYIQQTPLQKSYNLSNDKTKIYYKLENLQKVNNYKLRGTLNKMLQLTSEEKAKGVAAISSGNLGSCVAYGAQLLGIKQAVVIVPKQTPLTKINKIKYYQAEAKLLGDDYDMAHNLGMQYLKEQQLTYIDAYDRCPFVYAGHGTIGLEIMEQLPDVEQVVCPVGGGGLITGVAEAIKSINPQVKIYGVQTSACPALAQSIKDQHLYTEYPSEPSVCDALIGGIGHICFEQGIDLLEDVLLVDEQEIKQATAYMIKKEKQLIEPSSATVLAAVSKYPQLFTNKKTVLVISGGNIDEDVMMNILNEF